MPTSRQRSGIRGSLRFRKDFTIKVLVAMEDIKVKCYSGHTYTQRPVSFTFEGKDYEVAENINEWQEPEKKCFQVKTEGNKFFRLCYNEAQDKWQVAQIIP